MSSWSQFDPGWPGATSDSGSSDPGIDVVTINVPPAAQTRSVDELSARLKASGGMLIVDANSSDYIVAVNNGLRFSVTRQADGRFRITQSSAYLYAFIGVALIGALLLVRR